MGENWTKLENIAYKVNDIIMYRVDYNIIINPFITVYQLARSIKGMKISVLLIHNNFKT